jgi:hypothetical protein
MVSLIQNVRFPFLSPLGGDSQPADGSIYCYDGLPNILYIYILTNPLPSALQRASLQSQCYSASHDLRPFMAGAAQ